MNTSHPITLDELAVESVCGGGAAPEPPWDMALQANFGSLDAWREEFAAMAKAPAGGPRWLLLTFVPGKGTLVNHRARDGADANSTGVAIVACDSHTGPASTVDTFLRSVDHAKAYARYQSAVHAASEGIACRREALGAVRLLDVRRAGAFEADPLVIEGAQWRDPAKVHEWSGTLRPGEPVVVYCVYGHEVCRATALRLRAAGVDARFLEGGIDGWRKAGGPLSRART